MSWFWLALFAAILWGLGYTINQVTLQHFTPMELMLFESGIVFIICLISCFYDGSIHNFFDKLTTPKSLGLILLSTVIYITASILILKSISDSNAGLAAIVESIYPIFTVIFAYLIFGQSQLNLASGIGFILILTGIIVVKIYGR